MKKKIEVFCTLGPSSLNKKFLKSIESKVSLVRLNLSHLSLLTLKRSINIIRKNCSTPICIDTEGGQIRTKVKKRKFFFKNAISTISKKGGTFNLYPNNVYDQLKVRDQLDIGFDNLKIILIKKKVNKIKFKVLREGSLIKDRGVHIINRKIKLDTLTSKDLAAINLARKLNIKNYALSFTNNYHQIIKFNNLIPNCRKIYKIETRKALKNFNKMTRYGSDFLIDRGDLSKDLSIEIIPIAQRYILKVAKLRNIKIFVATNCLESMINNPQPTRGEANDIYNIIESGASGLVLAAETAIGKYPLESVNFINKMIKIFFSKNKFKNIRKT